MCVIVALGWAGRACVPAVIARTTYSACMYFTVRARHCFLSAVLYVATSIFRVFGWWDVVVVAAARVAEMVESIYLFDDDDDARTNGPDRSRLGKRAKANQTKQRARECGLVGPNNSRNCFFQQGSRF